MTRSEDGSDDELLEVADGSVVTLTLNRPDARNALSNGLLTRLAARLTAVDDDPDIRCVVVAGSETVFASGADLRALADADPAAFYEGERFRAWDAIQAVRMPMVAAVSGICLGGGLELALSCDVIVASETAKLGFPETALGLIPAAGGTQRLARSIGRAKAMDLILAGRLLSGAEAERVGLISRVTAPDRWREEAEEVARAIASRPPFAQRLAKECVNASADVSLALGVGIERRAFTIALAGEEARDGVSAFLNNRDARARQAKPAPPR